MDMDQNRLKSPVVWAAVAAQLLALLVTLGVIDTGLSNDLNAAAVAVLQLLVAFGVLNNPTDKTGF
ncbi:MAG: holin [Clostridiales bacterium]|nr:holin [Clostridiales bacterium]